MHKSCTASCSMENFAFHSSLIAISLEIYYLPSKTDKTTWTFLSNRFACIIYQNVLFYWRSSVHVQLSELNQTIMHLSNITSACLYSAHLNIDVYRSHNDYIHICHEIKLVWDAVLHFIGQKVSSSISLKKNLCFIYNIYLYIIFLLKPSRAI